MSGPPDKALTPAEKEAQQRQAREARLAMFARRPAPSSASTSASQPQNVSPAATTTTTTTTTPTLPTPPQATPSPTTTTNATRPITTTPTPQQPQQTQQTQRTTTTTTTTPTALSAPHTNLFFTPQSITLTPPVYQAINTSDITTKNPSTPQKTVSGTQSDIFSPPSTTDQLPWQHIFDQYLHQVIRHVFRITTDTDILSTSILDAKMARHSLLPTSSSVTKPTTISSSSTHINITTPYLPSALSTHVGQVTSTLKQEQRAGYTYLPLISRVILGEYVSQGLSQACLCPHPQPQSQPQNLSPTIDMSSEMPPNEKKIQTNSHHPRTRVRQQDCQKCRKVQPFLNVSHLESIFGEINSLMTGYQRIPTELIQSKAALSEPPSLDECFSVLCNIISKQGHITDLSHDSSPRATLLSSSNAFDRNTNHILTQLTDTNPSQLAHSDKSSPASTFQATPLPELQAKKSTFSHDFTDDSTILQSTITYYQQTAMMVGALSTQALTHQLPTAKAAAVATSTASSSIINQELTHSLPIFSHQTSIPPSSTTTTPSATAQSVSISSAPTNNTSGASQTTSNTLNNEPTQLQVVSTLINRIQISPTLSLSSPLSTSAHLTFNVHNVTLRSKSLLWFYLQACERIQTLYEYLSNLTSLHTLSGLNALDLVARLNRLLDFEINKHQNIIKKVMNNQEDDKYSRLTTHVSAAAIPHELAIKHLLQRRIELQQLNIPAQGSVGDLLHIVNFLAEQKNIHNGAKMGDDGDNSPSLHTIHINQNQNDKSNQNISLESDLSVLSGQTFNGMDSLSNDVNLLLGIDTNNTNLSTILSTIAKSQLLTPADFDLDFMDSLSNSTNLSGGLNGDGSADYINPIACYGTHPSELVSTNLDQPISMGFNSNTLYSALKQPGLDQPDGIQALTGSTTSTTGFSQSSVQNGSPDVLYTMNQGASDAYFSSLICPQVQPLTAAIVSSIVPNTMILSQTPSIPLVELPNPVPIFSYVHSQIAINGLVQVHTSKGPSSLPMIMLVNTLLSTLATISHRIFSAVGEILLSESDLALFIIHEHFKVVADLKKNAALATMLNTASSGPTAPAQRANRVIGANVTGPSSANGVGNSGNIINEIEQSRIECLRILYEKTPSYALFLQSLQSSQIKPQHHGITFAYDRNLAATISQYVQNRLITPKHPQIATPVVPSSTGASSTSNKSTPSQTVLKYTTSTGKRVQCTFPSHPFASVAAQKHTWSSTLGIFGGYGIHKHAITSHTAPLTFQGYFSYGITRTLPTLATSHTLPGTQFPQTVSVQQRFPVSVIQKPTNIGLEHNMRRKHPNNTYNSYADLSTTQNRVLEQFPAIAQYLVSVGDDVETDGVTQVVFPDQRIMLNDRNSFSQQLFNQYYRYTHTYGVHTMYAQQYLSSTTPPPVISMNQSRFDDETSSELTTIGKQLTTTTLVLHGNPIHILPLPYGFIQGLSDVMEGALQKVSGSHFDLDFIQSVFTINTGAEIKLDQFTFPANRSKTHSALVKSNLGKQLSTTGAFAQNSIQNNTSGTSSGVSSVATTSTTSFNTPLASNSTSNTSTNFVTPSINLSINPTLPKRSTNLTPQTSPHYHPTQSNPSTISTTFSPLTPSQQSIVLKHSPSIAAFLRTYNSYRSLSNHKQIREQGSVVLATVTYPLISYFLLTLMLTDTIRDVLLNKALIPLDIIDSCSSYEAIFSNWYPSQYSAIYSSPQLLSKDRDYQREFLKVQKQSSSGSTTSISTPSNTVLDQTKLKDQKENNTLKFSTQHQTHQSLLTLGIRESALSLALHSLERNQYDIMDLLKRSPLISSFTPQIAPSRIPSSRLTFGDFSPGYDASFAPDFIISGLAVLEQLAKKNHGINVNKSPTSPIQNVASCSLLGLFESLQVNKQRLCISSYDLREATTPISDSSYFVQEFALTQSTTVPITISTTIRPVYPIFTTIRPTSIAFATTIIRALVTLCSPASITGLFLAHPGYAPMYNSLALPQRQITQRVVQWIHLKRVLDLAGAQSSILSPLASLSSLQDSTSNAQFEYGLGPQPSNASPSVSPQFSSKVGVNSLDEDFAPMLSISSLFSLPGMIRNKLNNFDLPKAPVSFSLDVFSKKSTPAADVKSSSTSSTSVGSTTNAKHATGLNASGNLGNNYTKSFTLDKLQQYSGLSFLDAILPFLSNKSSQNALPTTAYPISLTNNFRTAKLFSISSLFGLLYNVHPGDQDPAFLNLKERSYQRVNTTFKRLRMCIAAYRTQVDGLNDRLLRVDSATRRRWVDFQTQYALQCIDYRKMSPAVENLPSAGSLLNWSSMLLTHSMRVIRITPQPVHLTLTHALSELGFSSQNLGMLALYHPIPSCVQQTTTPNAQNVTEPGQSWAQKLLSQPSHELLSQFNPYNGNNSELFPGKMELSYMLRFDDSPTSFKLSLPPHIYFHVLKHFTPMSIDDFHRNNSGVEGTMNYPNQRLHADQVSSTTQSTIPPATTPTTTTGATSSWFSGWGDQKRTKKSKTDANKNRLVSLISSSAAGISEMARGFLASHDSDLENEDTDKMQNETEDPAPSSHQNNTTTQQLSTRNSPTYLSMMYAQVGEILQVLSFFTQNSCDCSNQTLSNDYSLLYSPTPCHSGKALQSLAINPWVMPSGSNMNYHNNDPTSSSLITTNNHGFGGSILHDTNILANIVQQYREEQKFIQESHLFDSISNENIFSTRSNTHASISSANHNSVLSQSIQSPSMHIQETAQQKHVVFSSSTAPSHVQPSIPLCPLDDIGLVTQTTLQKLPKNIFNLTDICSQCGLLLKTASTSSATSSTMHTLRTLQSRLHQTLYPNSPQNALLANISSPSNVINHPLLPSNPAQRLQTMLEYTFGPAYSAAKQLGLWMLVGNTKSEHRATTHVFNIFLVPADEDNEMDDELDDTKEPDLTTIECIEAVSNVVNESGEEIEFAFSTYFIPVATVLQAIIAPTPRLSHIINLKSLIDGTTVDDKGEDLTRFIDFNPFKISPSTQTGPTTAATMHNMTDDTHTNDDKNVDRCPLVFCHDISSINDLSDNFEMDPAVITGLVAAFNHSQFKDQQKLYTTALVDIQCNKPFFPPTDAPTVTSTVTSSSNTNKKRHSNDMNDIESDNEDGDSGASRQVNPHLKPGAQYLHCGSTPPYQPSPTRYVRYFDLERLFYHSAAQVNDVRQTYANKLFMLCSQKAHELSVVQINSFLNREYQQAKLSTSSNNSSHGNHTKKPMLLSQCDQDQLYDSLYSYNLMFHLSHFFSEHSLIRGLDSASNEIQNYTDLPCSLSNQNSNRLSLKSSTKTTPFSLDITEQQQALIISNQALSSSLYGFRTEILCLSLESLHLTLPTLIRAFEQAEDNVQNIDDRIRDLEEETKKIQQVLQDAEPKLAQLAAAPNNGGMDYSSFMRFKSQIEMLRAQERRLQEVLLDFKGEKMAITGRFGRCKMIMSDPVFIQHILTIYNWVCSFILACMNSSCIYCRGAGIDESVNGSEDDNVNLPIDLNVDQIDEYDETTPGTDLNTSTITDGTEIIPQITHTEANHTPQLVTSADEKILVNLLSRTYTCTCARTLVGIIPEYWINDVWQWLNALNRINDATLRVLSQTNSLDSLLLLATSTVGGLGANHTHVQKQNDFFGGNNDDLSSLTNNPNLFNHVNQITALVNKSNISAGKVNMFTDILSIIQANKASLDENTGFNIPNQNSSDPTSFSTLTTTSTFPSIDLDLSTLRTLMEVKAEVDYDYTEKNKSYVDENFSSYTLCPEEDATISFTFDPELIDTSQFHAEDSLQLHKVHYLASVSQTQQYHSKTIEYHSLNDYITICQRNHMSICTGTTTSPGSSHVVHVHNGLTNHAHPQNSSNKYNNSNELRYINRYSPLYIFFAAQIAKCIPQSISSPLHGGANSSIPSLYPVIEATFIKIYAHKVALALNALSTSTDNILFPTFPLSVQSLSQYFQSNFADCIGQISLLSTNATNNTCTTPPSVLRGPLQLYLISVLRSFLSYSERANAAKDTAILDEHIKENQALVSQVRVSCNAINNAKKILNIWPYNQQSPDIHHNFHSTSSDSMNDYSNVKNGQKDNSHQHPHPAGYPLDFFTSILLKQSDTIIPINSSHRTQPHLVSTPLHDPTPYLAIQNLLQTSSTSINPNTTLYSAPELPSESFRDYNHRTLRQLPKDQDGHISPSGISWWPMQYQFLDCSTHPLWRTGKQSSELMALLLHLYASTASTDNVEVTNDQDRFLVWEAQREKHTHKGYLMDLFTSILLTEEEDEIIAKQSQSTAVVLSDISTFANFSSSTNSTATSNQPALPSTAGTATDTTLSNDYTYITQCNQAILVYAQWRQSIIRKSVIISLYSDVKSQYMSQTMSNTIASLEINLETHKHVMKKVAETLTTPSPTAPSSTPSLSNYGHSYLLPQITRLPNNHCYCGCSCFGCGCGFDYFSYSNISVDDSLRSIHIPPPFTTCICGQHTKSLTKLAIPTAITSALTSIQQQNSITTTPPTPSASQSFSFSASSQQLYDGNTYVNPADISSIAHPLSSQFTTKVSLHNILVQQYNSQLDNDTQSTLKKHTSMSDEDINGITTADKQPLPLKLLEVPIQFPLFDRFIHVLCNDVSTYMEDTLKGLSQLKERETNGVRVTDEDIRRYDEAQQRSERQGNAPAVVGGRNDPDGNNETANANDEQQSQQMRPITDRELISQTYWNTHFANKTLLLLSVICSRGKLALLRPEFATRIAIIIGGYLHKLTNPTQMRQLNINAEVRKKIKFSPKDLILLFVYILSSLALVPSGISIDDLTNLTFSVQHPLGSTQQVIKLLPGTIIQKHTPTNASALDQSNDIPVLGGLTILKSLVHKDAKFSTSDFLSAINVLLKTGSASTSTPLEQGIVDQPLSVVLHTIKTDATKHGANYATVRQYIPAASTQGQSSSSTIDNQNSAVNTAATARLVVYGSSHDDRSRAIARCQARAIGVLQLYSKLNALKGYKDSTQTIKTMLQNQNTCTAVSHWSWLYSNPTALTYAHLLHQRGIAHTADLTNGGKKINNRYVEELGLAWLPLPPLTPPIYVCLLNALKGEHEWDEFLTLRHFCANSNTIRTLQLNDTNFITNYTATTITPQFLLTPQWIDANYTQKGLNLPTYAYYSRTHSLTSEFWLKRLLALFDVYNAQLSRDERLLGTAVDDIMNTTTAPVNLFDFSGDDDDDDIMNPIQDGEPDDLELPAEFTDDLFLDIMEQPIKLSKSGAKIEWLSLYRSLLSAPQDPYTRQSLEVNDILPLPHIQYAIRLFKLRRGVL